MNNEIEKGKDLTCSVRNCQAPIEPGKEIHIGDKVYCGICGVAILKSIVPFFNP